MHSEQQKRRERRMQRGKWDPKGIDKKYRGW